MSVLYHLFKLVLEALAFQELHRRFRHLTNLARSGNRDAFRSSLDSSAGTVEDASRSTGSDGC